MLHYWPKPDQSTPSGGTHQKAHWENQAETTIKHVGKFKLTLNIIHNCVCENVKIWNFGWGLGWYPFVHFIEFEYFMVIQHFKESEE